MTANTLSTVVSILVVYLCQELPVAFKRTLEPQWQALFQEVSKQLNTSSFAVGELLYLRDLGVRPRRLSRFSSEVPALPKSLYPQFMAWSVPYREMEQDIRRVRQALTTVLAKASSAQEARNMLPERLLEPAKHCGVEAVQDFLALPRTSLDLYAGPPMPFADAPSQERLDREAIWDPRLLNMYEQVGPIIDTYLGYSFL